MNTHSVSLLDAELMLLDGQCRAEVQAVVDAAKARLASVAAHPDLAPSLASFVADAVNEARVNGRLVFHHKSIHRCSVCTRDAGYAVYPRSTRHHRKGETNYGQPLHMAGVELAHRLITFQGSVAVGACRECFEVARPTLAVALADVRAEIPVQITGHPPRFRRYDDAHCKQCGWTGHEGQMRSLRAVLGGTYRGGCPNCPAENLFLGERFIETLKTFTVVDSSTRLAAETGRGE